MSIEQSAIEERADAEERPGLDEETVNRVQDGLKASGPTLLHVRTDPERIGPNGTITAIRQKALANQTA